MAEEGTTFNIGANASKFVEELRKASDVLKQFASPQQFGRIQSQLTQLEQQFSGAGRGAIDFQTAVSRIGNVRIPGMDDFLQKMARYELAFERLQRLQANVVATSGPKQGVNLDQRLTIQAARDAAQAQAQTEAARRADVRDLAAVRRELEQIAKLERDRAQAIANQRGGLGPDQNRGILNPNFTRTVGGILPNGSQVAGLAGLAQRAIQDQGRVQNPAEAQRLALQQNAAIAAEAQRVRAAMIQWTESLRRTIAAQQEARDAIERARLSATAGYAQPGGGGGGFGGGGGSGGGGGGFLGNFRQGFREGRGPAPASYQIGQVLRTSALYGGAFRVLQAIEQTFKQSLEEAVQFQQGVTELALATDQSRDEAKGLANNLADAANSFGLASTDGIQAGIKAIGVFRGTDASSQTQGALARTASTSILQQSFLSGKPVQDLTANLAAIVQAFGVGAESIGRVTDTTTFFEKQFGIAVGSLSESIPAIASLAAQSGFSIEQTAGLAAAVQSRQAGTPAAASGLLSQILTREGEGTVQNVYRSLGIVGDTFKERFEQLAAKLPSLSDDQRGQVASAFGRGRSQSAAIGLLEELDRVFKLADRRSRGEGDGLTEQQAGLRMSDIGGQLAQLKGALSGLIKEVSQTGLLDAFGAAVIVIRELAQAGTQLLRVWNVLPSVIQDVIIAMGVLRLATLGGAGTAIAGRLQAAARARQAFPLGPYGSGLGVRGTAGAINAGAGGGAAGARAVGGAGVAALGGGLVVGAVAVLGSIALAKGAFDNLNAASRKAADSLTLVAATDFTNLEAVKGAQDSLVKAEKDRRTSVNGPIENIVGFFTGEDAKRKADIANIQATNRVLDSIEKRLEAQAKAVPTGNGGAFGDLGSDAVKTGYEELRRRGYSAASAMEELSKAIDISARSAADAKALFNPQAVAERTSSGLKDILGKFVGEDEKGLFSGDVSVSTIDDGFLSGANPKNFIKTLKGRETITNKEIAESIISSLPNSEDILKLMGPLLEAANKDGKITTEEALNIGEKALNLSDTTELARKVGEKAVLEGRDALKLGLTQALIDEASQQTAAQDPQKIRYDNLANNAAFRQDRLSEVPEGNLKAEQRALAQNIDDINKDIAAAKANGDRTDALIAERNQADIDFLNVSNRRVNDPLQLAAATAAANAAFTNDGGIDDSTAAVQQAKADLGLAASNKKADPIAYQKARQAYGEALAKDAESQKKSAEAISDLLGAQVGSELAQAISAMRDAEAAVAAAETAAEENAAEIQKLEAERGLRDARRAARSTRRLSNRDRTNPVQVAREDARVAREAVEDEERAFRGATSDGGKKITKKESQRLLDLTNQAEDATLSADQARFQQRLSNAQRAQQLGTMSNAAYQAYIDSEQAAIQAKLATMDKNTNGYQQLKDNYDDLVDLEQTLADSYNGQFNLGDIQLPTPYEARRYVQQAVGGPGAGVVGSGGSMVNSNNQISLSGLTTDELVAILASALGSGNTQTGAGYTP